MKRFSKTQKTWTITEEPNTLWRSAWPRETRVNNSILNIQRFWLLTFCQKKWFLFSSGWNEVFKNYTLTGSPALSFSLRGPWCWHQRHGKRSSAGNQSIPASSQPSLSPRRRTSGWTSSSAMLSPTIEEQERKEEFYQQLQAVIDRGGAKDMTILMGDFKAKIGSDNTGYKDIWGHMDWDRWTKMVSVLWTCVPWTSWWLEDWSIFPHKLIHKATWRSPDDRTENHIDHICISRKFRRSWWDVRVLRGAGHQTITWLRQQ